MAKTANGSVRSKSKQKMPSRKNARKASKPLAIPEPDWPQLSHPVANLRRCIFLLMNLDPQVALEREVHARGGDHPASDLYEKLLHRSAMQVILGNPLLQPLLGSVTADRDEFQRILISVEYFKQLVKSDMSPYRDLVASPPDGLIELMVEPPHDKPSGKQILERNFKERRCFVKPKDSPEIPDSAAVDTPFWAVPLRTDTKERGGLFSKKDSRLNETLGTLLLVLENWPAEADLFSKVRGGGRLNVSALASLMIETLNDLVLKRAKEEPIKFFDLQTLRKRLKNALAEAKEFEED